MLNLRARQYEPAMNRFSQKDMLRGSITHPLSQNRYGFVFNDPIGLIDPNGLDPILPTIAISGEDFPWSEVQALTQEEMHAYGLTWENIKEDATVYALLEDGNVVIPIEARVTKPAPNYHNETWFPDGGKRGETARAIMREIIGTTEDTQAGFKSNKTLPKVAGYTTLPAVLEISSGKGETVMTACTVRLFPHRGDNSFAKGTAGHYDIYVKDSKQSTVNPFVESMRAMVQTTIDIVAKQKSAASNKSQSKGKKKRSVPTNITHYALPY